MRFLPKVNGEKAGMGLQSLPPTHRAYASWCPQNGGQKKTPMRIRPQVKQRPEDGLDSGYPRAVNQKGAWEGRYTGTHCHCSIFPSTYFGPV